MKKVLLLFTLVLIQILTTSSGGNPPKPWEKENVSFPMMNQEIRHSLQENERQKDMRNNGAVNTTLETNNRNIWRKWEEKSKKIQDRLRFVSFAMQSIPTGIVMVRNVKQIRETQKLIIQEISDDPYTILVGLPLEIEFLDDLQMVSRLIAGIILSYGAINQMEKAERKILLNYALEEVEKLKIQSSLVLMKIRELKEIVQRNKSWMEYYVNRDKQIIDEIMSEIKSF